MSNLTNVCFIGAVSLQGWSGRLANLQSLVDDYARIGQTGSGAQIVGLRGRRCAISAWGGASSKAEAIGRADSLEAMQGLVVRVGDDLGRIFSRVRIYQIAASIKAGYGPRLPGGSQMIYRIDVQASMEVLP